MRPLLDLDEFAVEQRFAFADLDDGYGLIVVVDHSQRRGIQLVARVRLGRTGGRGHAIDRGQRAQHRAPPSVPQDHIRHRSAPFEMTSSSDRYCNTFDVATTADGCMTFG